MANSKKFPILITCSCGLTPTLNFVSAGQTCEPRNCGESACGEGFDDITGEGGDTSTGPCPCGEGYTTYLPVNCKTYESYSSSPVQLADCFPQTCYKCTEYDDEACATIKTVVSPKCTNLAQRCRNRAYRRIVTKDTSGESSHGRITTKQYSINAEGECVSTTTCSGTSTTTVESESEYTSSGSSVTCTSSLDTTETTVRTFNSDCTYEDVTTCSGTSSYDVDAGYCMGYGCESTCNADCTWDGSTYIEGPNETGSGCKTVTSPFSDAEGPCGPCDGASTETKTTITPTVDCTITTTYSEPDEEQICDPKTLPSYPAFEQCNIETPTLQPGQGFSNGAYKQVDAYEPLRTKEQKFRYRIEHPPIFPACYLKVWVTKVTQKWRYESCETSFDPCCVRYVKDGPPIETDEAPYIWTPTNCDYDIEEDLLKCEYKIYSTHREVIAGENESVHVEIKKYSYVSDYEPENPDADGNQPCRPNGWPLIKC